MEQTLKEAKCAVNDDVSVKLLKLTGNKTLEYLPKMYILSLENCKKVIY